MFFGFFQPGILKFRKLIKFFKKLNVFSKWNKYSVVWAKFEILTNLLKMKDNPRLIILLCHIIKIKNWHIPGIIVWRRTSLLHLLVLTFTSMGMGTMSIIMYHSYVYQCSIAHFTGFKFLGWIKSFFFFFKEFEAYFWKRYFIFFFFILSWWQFQKKKKMFLF